jgi:hypothetical protein
MWEILLAWFKTHEFIAIWLEGIALVLIFGLDWKERIDQRRERREQHKETAAQLAASQSQLEAMKKSADAATEAALASKKSAEIAAALHRPFVGLSDVRLEAGWGTRLWTIAFVLKNYGTLPALRVRTTINFVTDNAPRGQETRPTSVQIFPSSEGTIMSQFDMGEPDRALIHNETKKLRIDVSIPYEADDGRHFEYTSQVVYSNGRFSTDKSETH